jgi:hypothetical protein
MGGACSKHEEIKLPIKFLLENPKGTRHLANLGMVKNVISKHVKKTHRADGVKVPERRLPLPPYTKKIPGRPR